MPVMTLMSVDLPAPFSPTRAWTSPPRSSNDTSSSARVAPNRLDIPRTARTGAASASVTGRRPARYTPRHPPNGPTCTPRGGQRSKLLVTTVTHIGAPGASRSLAVAGQGKGSGSGRPARPDPGEAVVPYRRSSIVLAAVGCPHRVGRRGTPRRGAHRHTAARRHRPHRAVLRLGVAARQRGNAERRPEQR